MALQVLFLPMDFLRSSLLLQLVSPRLKILPSSPLWEFLQEELPAFPQRELPAFAQKELQEFQLSSPEFQFSLLPPLVFQLQLHSHFQFHLLQNLFQSSTSAL